MNGVYISCGSRLVMSVGYLQCIKLTVRISLEGIAPGKKCCAETRIGLGLL